MNTQELKAIKDKNKEALLLIKKWIINDMSTSDPEDLDNDKGE